MPPRRVLVVEDYEPFRRFICSALQEAEFQTIQAADGLEAVQKAEELQPDLILLDIGLPKLNGIEVARWLRKRAPHLRLLFVSQESSPEVIQETFRLGAGGYVHKLHAERDLLLAVNVILDGKRFVSSGLEYQYSMEAQPSQRHEILFCSDDEAIVEGLRRFVADALNAANAAVVLVAESHRGCLLQGLRENGVDVEGAIQRGTYLSLDADQAPDPDRFNEAVEALRQAAANAGNTHPRVAVCGERCGRLWAAGKADEALQLEQLCAQLAMSADIDILCAYPVAHIRGGDDALKRICAEHSAVSSRQTPSLR